MTAAASETGSPLAPGYKLDRYELLCPIAEGGMASVWVARQRGKHGFEKLVAIKTILPKFASDPRFHEMFLGEARIASRIEHLNVAQIFDLGEEHDVLYMAMEYVDGEALSKLNRACQKKCITIPPGVVMRVLADACSGLHEAHELRDGPHPLDIVHRDVSPHNILVSNRGIAKLIDFGIAKARSRVGNDTNSGVLKGKIQYMAPEQALGRPVDRRADVWAVGAILYHLLSGKPAYEGDNQLATLHLLGSGRPPVPLPDAIHPAIRGVVRKALAYAPENRYQTASELREAIEDAMVESMVPTTSADMAAFAAQHLGERAERRRASIELALAAAAERERVEALLEPTSDRSSSGMIGTSVTPSGVSRTSNPTGSAHSGPPPSARFAADWTDAEAPAAKAIPDSAAKLTPRVSTPPPHARSYGTLGSAALDGSELERPLRSRKGLVTVLALVAVAALVATGVSFTMFRPKAEPSVARVPAAPPGASATPSTGPTPGGSASAASVAAPSASASTRTIPVIAASSLPPAHPAPQPPRWVAPPPAPAPAPPAPRPSRNPKQSTMGSRSARLLLSASLLFAATATSAGAYGGEPSASDKDTARGLMTEGRANREKGDLKGALKAFTGADAIMHVPTTGLELARAQAALGQLVEARDTAQRVMRTPEYAGEPAPFKAARDAASTLNDQLESRIPTLKVNLKNVPVGVTATLTIDGIDVPSEVIGQPRKLNPGHHDLEARAGTAYGKQELDIAEKDSKEVSIELSAQSASPAAGAATDTVANDAAVQRPEQPAASQGRSGGSKLLVIGGFALAGAGVLAGTITGLMSMSKTSSIKNSAACNATSSGIVCNGSEDGDISSARTLATISTVSFIAGGVGAALGLVGLFVGGGSSGEPSAVAQPPQAPDESTSNRSSRLSVHVSPWIGLGSMGLSGTF